MSTGITDKTHMWRPEINWPEPIQRTVDRVSDSWFGRHKKATAVGILAIWAGISYEASPIAFFPESPTEATGDALVGVAKGFDWALTRADSKTNEGGKQATETADSSPPASPSEQAAVLVTNAPNNQTTGASLAAVQGQTTETLAPFGEATVVTNALPELPVVTSAQVSEAAPTTLPPQAVPAAVATDVLPNPVQYSDAAGGVVCSGPEMLINLDPNSGVPPLKQMHQLTHEDWDVGLPNSPEDNQLFIEASGGQTSFYVRLGCVGLDNY